MKKATWIRVRWITVAALVFALLAFPDPAFAFRGGYHFELTRDCLIREGFSQNAIQLVQISNVFSDIATDIPEGRMIDRSEREELGDGSSRAVPMNSIWAAAAQYLHWGYLSGYAMISEEWERLEANTRYAIQEAMNAGNVEGFLAALGTSLHVVQDFYAHSNWSGIDDWEGDATWFDVYPLAMGMGGDELYTFGSDGTAIEHDRINRDHAGREDFETAYREAFYATCQWVELVRSWVRPEAPEFWEAATSYEGYSFEDDERETRQLLWYLGTWKEPPIPNTTGQGWTGCSVFGCDYQGSTEDLVFAALRFATSDNHTWQVWTHYAHIIASPERPAVDLPDGDYVFIPRHDWLVIDTEHVGQTDSSYLWDIDPGDQADFYAKIWATELDSDAYGGIDRDNDRFYIETMYEGYDDLHPHWLTLIPFEPPERQNDRLAFEYGIWDDDGTGLTFRAGDTPVDISPQAGQTTLFFGLSPLAPNYGLGFAADFPMSIGSQGHGGDGNEALVTIIVDYSRPARAEPVGFLDPGLILPPMQDLTAALQPYGFVDVANCQQISGWAWDPKTPNQPISVEIYDVRDGTEMLLSSTLAELPRGDLGAVLGDHGDHGFFVQTSSILHDGQEHQLRVYAVNSDPESPNVILPPSSPAVPPVLVCPQFQPEPTSAVRPTDTHIAEPTSAVRPTDTHIPEPTPTGGQEASPAPGFPCPGAALPPAVGTALWLGKRKHPNKET